MNPNLFATFRLSKRYGPIVTSTHISLALLRLLAVSYLDTSQQMPDFKEVFFFFFEFQITLLLQFFRWVWTWMWRETLHAVTSSIVSSKLRCCTDTRSSRFSFCHFVRICWIRRCVSWPRRWRVPPSRPSCSCKSCAIVWRTNKSWIIYRFSNNKSKSKKKLLGFDRRPNPIPGRSSAFVAERQLFERSNPSIVRLQNDSLVASDRVSNRSGKRATLHDSDNSTCFLHVQFVVWFGREAYERRVAGGERSETVDQHVYAGIRASSRWHFFADLRPTIHS